MQDILRRGVLPIQEHTLVIPRAASECRAFHLAHAIWGILVWKETKGASRGTQVMIAGMFAFLQA